jgi:MOSC domain-containing protein YiiM
MDAMTAAGAKNDQVSAIKVHGGENCCAVVYENDDFSGWSASYPSGDYPF